MQDIDFDEIDRAVSSVTNPTTKTVVAAPVVPATPLVVPAVAESVTVSVGTASPAPTVTSPTVRRSSGRFMDVVHASSDMRPPREPAAAAPSMHREEVTERSEPSNRPVPTAIASSAFHWPDAIAAPVSVVTPTSIVETPAVIEESATPLESPFLSDAKVEKRPLGAFSDAEPEDEVSIVEPQPVELHEELLLLEDHYEETPAIAEPVVEPEVITATPAIEDVPAGPTSITQQYTEQPSTASQESGSIFDTESYHQPLVHTPKKHAGALVVVWIIALILVGGGIGAGVYFVVLPMLG